MKVLSSRFLVFHRFLDVFFPAKWREFVSRLQFHEKRKPNEWKIENSARRSLEQLDLSNLVNAIRSLSQFKFSLFGIWYSIQTIEILQFLWLLSTRQDSFQTMIGSLSELWKCYYFLVNWIQNRYNTCAKNLICQYFFSQTQCPQVVPPVFSMRSGIKVGSTTREKTANR